MGLVVLRHVEYSQSRDQTRVPCIGRWILNHWTTREVSSIKSLFCFDNSKSKHFLSPQKFLLASSQSLPCSPPKIAALISIFWVNSVYSGLSLKLNRTVCTFWAWLFSLNLVLLRFTCVCAAVVHTLYCWVEFHFRNPLQFMFLLFCWQTSGLFPGLGFFLISLLWMFLTKTFCVHMFSFLLINT